MMLDWLRTWRIPLLGWTPLGTLALLAVWAVGLLCFLPVAALGDWLIVYQQWPEWPVMAIALLLFAAYWIAAAAWLQATLLRLVGARREAEPPVAIDRHARLRRNLARHARLRRRIANHKNRIAHRENQ